MEQRQIAYYYNGILKSEETDLDLGGVTSVPVEGEILVRPGGKRWKVVRIIIRHDSGNAVPTYMIYMTRASALRVAAIYSRLQWPPKFFT